MKKKMILVYALLGYLCVTCLNLTVQDLRLQNYHAKLSIEKDIVMREQQSLQKSLEHFKTEQGVEELARKRLGYYKQNEVPVRVIENPQMP